MKCRWLLNFIAWFSVSLIVPSTAQAVSPTEVQQQLADGQKILFVDVRSTSMFKQGHIPNAINIPAALVDQKQLPPLGRVVVYDEGLSRESATAAAAALNRKAGITAEVMDGGFAAWQMSHASSTQAGGLRSEVLPMITYQELKRKTNDSAILVDLRKPRQPAPAKAASAAAPANELSLSPLTSLEAEFPGFPVTRDPFGMSGIQRLQGANNQSSPLLVLIDDGDGKAQETARLLKASGNLRFVILVGGETILERKGQRGLQRAGAAWTVTGSPNIKTNR